jgi:hypothetical protein
VTIHHFLDRLPAELSDLYAILVALFPDRESLEELLRHRLLDIRHSLPEAVPHAWAIILEEAHEKMGDVISILEFVCKADMSTGREDLVRAVRAYRKRRGWDLGTIAPLADAYVEVLAHVESSSWQGETDWIVGTLDVNRALRAQEIQTVEQLLAQSRQLLDKVRGETTARRGRQRAMDTLTRMGDELKSNVHRLAASNK